jgi:hypothetical protein
MADLLNNVTGVSRRSGRVVVTAATTLEAYQQHVRCSTSGAGAYNITFPPPESVPGAFFFVYFTSKTTDNVTLLAVDRGSNVVLDASDEHVLIMSTGDEYIVPYAIGPSIS